MAVIADAMESIGKGMAEGGEALLGMGGVAWSSAGKVVSDYIAQDPTGTGIGGWKYVSTLYSTFSGIGASLLTLFFLIGWLRDAIDIHNQMTIDQIFRMFIRFILTAQSIVFGLRLIKDLMVLTAALTGSIGTQTLTLNSSGVFTTAMDGLEGLDCLLPGLLFFLGGLVGMAVTLVCSVKIMLAIFSRFFRMFVIVPFAPIALSTFAGGRGLSQTGVAWIKTFFGYLLEILVIAMALQLSVKMFATVKFFEAGSIGEGWAASAVTALLAVCEAVAPILAATACVTGAEGVIRKSLGLNV